MRESLYMRFFPLTVFILGMLQAAVGQATSWVDHPPGGMVLLPGYMHMSKQGIDTQVGTIEKPGGLRIRYDIGSLAGFYADPAMRFEEDSVLWSITQRKRGLTMVVTRYASGNLFATFRETCANFLTGDITSEEQVAEFTLMIGSYYEEPPRLDRIPKKARVFYRGC